MTVCYLLAIVVLLHNDCLLASSSSCEQNDNSAFSHATYKLMTQQTRNSASNTPDYASETYSVEVSAAKMACFV